MSNFRMGTDPELMLISRKTGIVVSAVPIIPEGKGKGRPVKQGSILHDGVNVELNTDPADSEKEFVETMGMVLKQAANIVGNAGCKLVVRASADFPEDQLQHKDAKEFGCDEDYDAWELVPNNPPSTDLVGCLRSAGGHLHIGKGSNSKINELLDHEYGKAAVIRACDVFCGIPALFLDKDDSAKRRRELYGKAGAHRPKEYGVEYRGMTSWWLLSPNHSKIVYQLTAKALQVVSNNLDINTLEETQGAGSEDFVKLVEAIGGSKEVIRIINESDAKAAKRVYDKHIKPLLDKKTVALIHKELNRDVDFYNQWMLPSPKELRP